MTRRTTAWLLFILAVILTLTSASPVWAQRGRVRSNAPTQNSGSSGAAEESSGVSLPDNTGWLSQSIYAGGLLAIIVLVPAKMLRTGQSDSEALIGWFCLLFAMFPLAVYWLSGGRDWLIPPWFLLLFGTAVFLAAMVFFLLFEPIRRLLGLDESAFENFFLGTHGSSIAMRGVLGVPLVCLATYPLYLYADYLGPKERAQRITAATNVGVGFMKAEMHDAAIGQFSKVIKQHGTRPESADAYYFRGSIYSLRNRDDEAIADFTHYINFHPTRDDGYVVRGVSYLVKADYEKAIADFSEAIRLKPTAENYDARGTAYERAKVFD
ncbi:MAG: tetratricopeptide repeat protein [Planctomycetes bacterium]|nr:tetratricopeptide repeat protein [Planctomycetota bacterium]